MALRMQTDVCKLREDRDSRTAKAIAAYKGTAKLRQTPLLWCQAKVAEADIELYKREGVTQDFGRVKDILKWLETTWSGI
eukprot:5208131-Amphidinium_carterae.1